MTFIKNQDVLNSVSQCLGVSSEHLEKALCQRVIAARGEVMEKVHTISEAIYGKDAFAKVRNLYRIEQYLWQELLSLSFLEMLFYLGRLYIIRILSTEKFSPFI